MHKYCLERYKKLTLNEKSSTGTLIESEWIFVFERIAALARKESDSEDAIEVKSVNPDTGCVLDLRYISRLVDVSLNRFYFRILNALLLYETCADYIGSITVICSVAVRWTTMVWMPSLIA